MTGPGRPPQTEEEKAEIKRNIVSKIEPYLKSGLSISKAVLEAGVSRAEFYRLINEDEDFRDKINQFRNFTAVLLNNAIIRELQAIVEKQNGNESKGIKPQKLTKEDRSFLQWFALNSNLTKAEFGERKDISLFDPESEIQKIKGLLEDKTTKEIKDV